MVTQILRFCFKVRKNFPTTPTEIFSSDKYFHFLRIRISLQNNFSVKVEAHDIEIPISVLKGVEYLTLIWRSIFFRTFKYIFIHFSRFSVIKFSNHTRRWIGIHKVMLTMSDEIFFASRRQNGNISSGSFFLLISNGKHDIFILFRFVWILKFFCLLEANSYQQ